MIANPQLSSNNLLRDFDVLLVQNQRIQRENDLLRLELMRHPSGAMQIRSVERSLGRAYRDIHSEPGGLSSTAYAVE